MVQDGEGFSLDQDTLARKDGNQAFPVEPMDREVDRAAAQAELLAELVDVDLVPGLESPGHDQALDGDVSLLAKGRRSGAAYQLVQECKRLPGLRRLATETDGRHRDMTKGQDMRPKTTLYSREKWVSMSPTD